MNAVARPESAKKSAGLLGYELFQIAYVTNDLDRAVKEVSEIYGIRNWTHIDPGTMRIALAWTNGQQIEIIETAPDQHVPLYDDWIDRKGAFVTRHHHFGYFINSDAEWDLLRSQIAASGRKVWMDVETEAMKVIYVDAPEFGHFLEYIYPNEHGHAFFSGIASN